MPFRCAREQRLGTEKPNQLPITVTIVSRPQAGVDRSAGSFCSGTFRGTRRTFPLVLRFGKRALFQLYRPCWPPMRASALARYARLGQNQAMNTRSDTVWIEAHARSLGFDLCGVVRAEQFPELAQTEEWLARGYAGEMKYLADARRREPTSVMHGTRSVIVCALNYNTDLPKSTEGSPGSRGDDPRGWISRYAWGADYHQVLHGKLTALADAMHVRFEKPFEARVYADTGPVQERILAKYAGLGWLGKNTLLLNQQLGSFFFLGVVLTTLDLQPTLGSNELPPPDLSGTCRRCPEACRTQPFFDP